MGNYLFGHPLTWLYRRLEARYPAVFIFLELQTAFLIGAGSVVLIGYYYDADRSDVVSVIALTCALTAVAIAIVLRRIYKRLGPLTSWIAGARGPAETEAAWQTAVNLPIELIRRDAGFPVFGVAVPVSIAAVVLYDLSWFAFFPILMGGLIALGYSAILHYLALELAMRPILFDINAALVKPVKITRPSIPLRVKLLASLPLINVITGVTVAALTSDGGGVEALSLNVLVALTVAFLISFELTVLLSRSILRPVEDLEAATERIRQGRFDEHVPVTTADEFGELSSAFNQMVDGLAERERLREAFGTYLDEEVARHIISEEYDPAGREVDVSLVFCDVREFTEHSASASATEVVSRLNELFEVDRADHRAPPRPRRPVHRRRAAGGLERARARCQSRRPRRPVRCRDRAHRQQPQAGWVHDRRRGELGDGRRRVDRRCRAALVQRHRRRRQPRLARRGDDARDRRPRADHRGDEGRPLGDDRGPGAGPDGDPGLRGADRPLRTRDPAGHGAG